MDDVDSIIKNNTIVVFSSSGCPYCREAINALQGTGKTFEVIEATSAQRNILKQKTGSSSVPNIWVKGKYVGGCNDGPEPWMGIKKILKNNGLESLINGN
eukprot:gene22732-31019_t